MASRQFKNDVDSFCFICGEFIKVKSKKFVLSTNLKLCEAYEAYFNLKISNQDENWVPHFACVNCKNNLEAWYRGENRHMKFAVPRLWREPSDHGHDCYFCMVNPSKRRSGENAEKIFYPDLSSTSSPIPHDESLHVPSRSGLDSFEVQASQSSTATTNTDGSDFMPKSQSFGPHFVASDWRLFIDSSSKSLKAVLLHNGNVLPSLPLAHS